MEYDFMFALSIMINVYRGEHMMKDCFRGRAL